MKHPLIVKKLLNSVLVKRFVNRSGREEKITREQFFARLSQVLLEKTSIESNHSDKEVLIEFIKNGQIALDGRTGTSNALYKYFQRKDTTSINSIYKRLILCYLGYSVNQWDNLIEEWRRWEKLVPATDRFPVFDGVFESDDVLSYETAIYGIWEVYIKKPEGIWLTYLEITESRSVRYRSIFDEELVMGGDLHPQSMEHFAIRLFTNNSNRIFTIFGRVGRFTAIGKEALIPVCGVVNHYQEIHANPMMLRKYKKNISFEDTPFPRVLTTSRDIVDEQILVYLSQKSRLKLDFLKEDNLENINYSMLKRDGRNKFHLLKSVIGNETWVSVSRIVDDPYKMALWSWEFVFDEVSQRCNVVRKSISASRPTIYSGELKIVKESLWIEFYDADQNFKFFHGKSKPIPGSGKVIALGLSSSIHGSEANMLVSKEILMPKSSLGAALEGGSRDIYYSAFRDKAEIPPEYKMHLSMRNNAVLTYSNSFLWHSRYSRQWDAAQKYNGDYFIYTMNLYKENTLFRSTLRLDSLGLSTLYKKYEKEDTIIKYIGSAEHINKTLRLELEHQPRIYRRDNKTEEKRQFCEIKMICQDSKSPVYVGFMTDTDADSLPDCSVAIMIRADLILGEGLYNFNMSQRKDVSLDRGDGHYKEKELDILLECLQQHYGAEFKDKKDKELKLLENFFKEIGGVSFNKFK
jgi:hypothetical protein